MRTNWLFICNVLAHWIAAMSGIVSFVIGAVENFRNKKVEAGFLYVAGIIFLLVASSQAWQDEHTNSEVLIAEKHSAVSEREFWKGQSYEKDRAIQSRDELLAKNYTALISQQESASDSQKALANLSQKIVEIDKPEKLKTTNYYLGMLRHKTMRISLLAITEHSLY